MGYWASKVARVRCVRSKRDIPTEPKWNDKNGIHVYHFKTPLQLKDGYRKEGKTLHCTDDFRLPSLYIR